jgi:hypothetical protein
MGNFSFFYVMDDVGVLDFVQLFGSGQGTNRFSF